MPNINKLNQVNRGLICQTGIIPNNLQLIQSTFPLKVLEAKSIISEAAGSEGRPVLKITGVFQKADTPNQNGRDYPYDIITEAVTAIQDDIGNRAVLGEYEHPTDAKIHLDRVSHIISKLWMEGKYVYGVAEVLEDMPCGKMLAALLRYKVQVGISSRGVGEMETVTEGQSEIFRVCRGYRFVTWDIVAEPSVSEAVMHVMEGRDRLLTRSTRTQNPQANLVNELNKWLKQR